MAKAQSANNNWLRWYEIMLLVRRFEEKSGQLYSMQKIRGFCHLYIGQEAVAAGTVSAIREDDNMITAYRDHGLAIAKGMTARECMAELMGKATGCSKGKGGSMHFFSKEKRFFGGHGIVGAQIPLGAGIAFAEKYNETDRVTICFFGDGAFRQGALHETFNMAAMWKLPVIFVVENNFYSMGTSLARSGAIPQLNKIGDAYGMANATVDGMNPEIVHTAMSEAVVRARKGEGPTFLEIKTYRYKGHSMSDPAKYRTREEVDQYKAKDPIETAAAFILKNKLGSAADLESIEQKIVATVEDAVQFAETSPFPDASEMYADNYADADYPFILN